MDYNYVPGPRDPRYMPDPRGQNVYTATSSVSGRSFNPTANSDYLQSPSNISGRSSNHSTNPGFLQSPSSGPGYTPAANLGPNYLSGPSSVSYMAAPGHSYSSVPPMAATSHGYSSAPLMSATSHSYPSSIPPMTTPMVPPIVSSLAHNYATEPDPNAIDPATYDAQYSARRDSLVLCPENSKIVIQQQPKEALQTLKEKVRMRKPIDPPPCLELIVSGRCGAQQGYIQNPYTYCTVVLIKADVDEFVDLGKDLMGTLTSSCNRLKDLNNKEGAWFVFPDISVMVAGKFRLLFSLHEMVDPPTPASSVTICKVMSEPFEVFAAKDYKGLGESTMLTRSFAEQGIRLRLRKEPKGAGGKRRSPGSQGGHANANILPAAQYPPANDYSPPVDYSPTDEYTRGKRVKHEYHPQEMSHSSAYQPTLYSTPQTPQRGFHQLGGRAYGSNESYVGSISSSSVTYTPTAPLDMHHNPVVAYNNQMSPLPSSYAGYNAPLMAPHYNPRGASVPSLEDPVYSQQQYGEPDGQFQL
ncbi:hypothetical protein NX059_007696 [Plenodomus lindquistii]|nr:hypothetical protein NX059_007696 [Plenodomus lindquistii]